MAARPVHYISLCTGSGALDAGIGLALPHARPVCYVEREVTAAGVLAKAIEQGWVADAPIWTDLLTFDGYGWRGLVDGVAGGFPCQPHSYAGKRLGELDPRNLWPAVARVVFDATPTWAFFENVPGILPYFWGVIRPDLQALGYEVEEGIFSAEEVGASHLRERLFWLAYRAPSRQRPGGEEREGKATWSNPDDGGSLAYRQGGDRRLPDERWSEIREPERRGAELADGAGVQPSGEQPAGASEARHGREEVGDTELARRTQARARLALDTGAESEPRDGKLGDTNSEAQGFTSRGKQTYTKAFPPGPADAAGWAAWLAEWPGTEPSVRRDADGLAFRSDRLRVLGNGVVPLAAAHALLSLQARMGVEL